MISRTIRQFIGNVEIVKECEGSPWCIKLYIDVPTGDSAAARIIEFMRSLQDDAVVEIVDGECLTIERHHFASDGITPLHEFDHYSQEEIEREISRLI